MSFLLKRKKIFLFVFLFIFLLGSFQINTTNAATPSYSGWGNSSGWTSGGTTLPSETPAQSDTEKLSFTDQILSGAFGVADWLLRAFSPIWDFLGLLILTLTGILLGVASGLFDLIIQIGIYGISDIVGAKDSPIKEAWSIFRNLANIGIIFALVFIAIGTILQKSGYEGKKLLGRVIVAALLMNFSFFFGAIVVDVSNQMAISVYGKIKEVTEAGQGQSANLGTYIMKNSGVAVFITAAKANIDGNAKKENEETLSNSKWEMMKAYGSGLIGPPGDAQDNLTYRSVSIWMGAIASLVLAVVLFIGGAMVLGRLIAILLLLVVSPIAFASMILPSTQKISDKWWQDIIGQSFFLPAFLLFILIGLKILGVFQKMDMKKYIDGINGNPTSVGDSFIGTIKIITGAGFAMAIVIGLFIAALIVAKKIEHGSGGAVGKISASVTSATGGAMLGSAAFLGRNTAGAGASLALKSDVVKKFAQSMPMVGGAFAKQLEKIGKSSFDLRGSKTFKGVASATGVGGDFNKTMATPKDGFKGQTDRLSKMIQDTYKAIPDNAEADIKKEKDAYEIATKELETKKSALKALDKDLATGRISAGVHSAKVAALDVDGAKAANETARGNYETAKNPAKAAFVAKTDGKVSIKNIWFTPATNTARDVIKKEIRSQRSQDTKDLMDAINNNKPSTP